MTSTPLQETKLPRHAIYQGWLDPCCLRNVLCAVHIHKHQRTSEPALQDLVPQPSAGILPGSLVLQ